MCFACTLALLYDSPPVSSSLYHTKCDKLNFPHETKQDFVCLIVSSWPALLCPSRLAATLRLLASFAWRPRLGFLQARTSKGSARGDCCSIPGTGVVHKLQRERMVVFVTPRGAQERTRRMPKDYSSNVKPVSASAQACCTALQWKKASVVCN